MQHTKTRIIAGHVISTNSPIAGAFNIVLTDVGSRPGPVFEISTTNGSISAEVNSRVPGTFQDLIARAANICGHIAVNDISIGHLSTAWRKP